MSYVDVLPIMDEIMAWLRANDIEPTDVPIRAVPVIADGQITCPMYLRRDGSRYRDDSGEPARSTVTVPLKQRPPASLLAWLGPPSSCPNCGWAGESELPASTGEVAPPSGDEINK